MHGANMVAWLTYVFLYGDKSLSNNEYFLFK
jgi:hypothetical protein